MCDLEPFSKIRSQMHTFLMLKSLIWNKDCMSILMAQTTTIRIT